MTPVVIRGVGLCKQFGSIVAVEDVDLEVRRGQTLVLMGPSGCGKTTTLRLIAGFETPDAGLIELEGQVVFGPRQRSVPPERRRVGMVFQDYALFPHLDVAGNVGFGLQSGKDAHDRVRDVLDLVGLSGLERRYPHELSGGQQQRVALARALAPSPALLLLDEPFSNLDATLRARVRADVHEILHRAGATTIFVTHDQDEALSLADHVAVMDHGRILQVGTPEDIYRHPTRREVALLIGEANVLSGEASGGRVDTELGRLAMLEPIAGPVDIVIRPEALCLQRSEREAHANAEVMRREFFGHDQRVVVRILATGRQVSVRMGPEPLFRPGDRVHLQVRGPVAAFAADAQTETHEATPMKPGA